jgi:hypothetical protein
LPETISEKPVQKKSVGQINSALASGAPVVKQMQLVWQHAQIEQCTGAGGSTALHLDRGHSLTLSHLHVKQRRIA